MLESNKLNIAVIGASGAIGSEFVKQFSSQKNINHIYAFSRSNITWDIPNISYNEVDLESEKSIEKAAGIASEKGPIDIMIVATGILHNKNIKPEKALKELSFDNLNKILSVNTFGPALVMKHFLPKLNKDRKAIFAALSARVGSISDNHLGGWYSYRASKAALNMLIKTASIETSRSNKQAIIVGLHPGTVDSNLSKPFQKNVQDGKLFEPDYSVSKLSRILENLKVEDSGKCFAWDGKEIAP